MPSIIARLPDLIPQNQQEINCHKNNQNIGPSPALFRRLRLRLTCDCACGGYGGSGGGGGGGGWLGGVGYCYVVGVFCAGVCEG